ncbi:MAG: hypothetical protein ACRDTF_11260 [Pseudonocardiaceae bacterium]
MPVADRGGEPWLWVPGRRLKGVVSHLAEGRILMGQELAGYGLVVDADFRMNAPPYDPRPRAATPTTGSSPTRPSSSSNSVRSR